VNSARIPLAALAVVLGLLIAAGHLNLRPAQAQPLNDNLANAITVTTPSPAGIVATVDTTGATSPEVNEQTAFTACTGVFPSPQVGKTVWYTWTSPASPGIIVLDTFGSNFDTVLAVYTGSAFPLNLEACNDWLDLSLDVGPSALALSFAASTTYSIQVGSFFDGPPGNLVLNIADGAGMYVNSPADNNASDAALTLREAMLLAVGGTGASGLNRALSADELNVVLDPATAGPGGSDAVHFNPTTLDINLLSAIPTLSTSNDHVSGIGAGVEVDGLLAPVGGGGVDCFDLTGANNAISGLTIRRCTSGIRIGLLSGSNRIGGTLSNLERNVIVENGDGITIASGSLPSNSILGNHIGVDVAGNSALGNEFGVFLASSNGNFIGDGTAAGRNVISANETGVVISISDGNVVRGNYIGTNAAGNSALPNTVSGVLIFAGSDNNIIGPQFAGSFPLERNVISGNQVGVHMRGATPGTGNIVRGNYIGLAADGSTALGNSGPGVWLQQGVVGNTIGGSVTGEGNVISGNNGNGVTIEDTGTSSNSVRGNYIGVQAGGLSPRGNTSHGVYISNAAGNNVTGANTIGFNGGDGVRVDGATATGNMVFGNSIHSNTGKGIENINGGNDEPAHAPPVITSAGSAAGTACINCIVDVYSDSADEGRVYDGFTVANSAGIWSFSGAVTGPFVTATAENAAGSTSEFSLPFACSDSDADLMCDSGDPCPVTPDCDGDGWKDGSEANFIGTDPLDACADTTTAYDERGPGFGEPVPPWPPDFNDDGSVTGADLSAVAADIGKAVPPAPPRKDISDPQNQSIGGADLSRVAGPIGTSCTP